MAGALASMTEAALALGLRIADQDPLATARGNAYVATADQPSAIYYNPAGLAFLGGMQAQVGLYAVAPSTEFTSPTGERVETESRVSLVPQVYGSWAWEKARLAVGVGLYAPYGLAMEWPASAAFGGPVEGSMTYLTVNPVVAWRPHPAFSVGMGLTANMAEMELVQPAFTAFPGSQNSLEGDGTDVGFNAGLLWRPHVKHAFGVSYRSPTTVDFEGTSTTRGSLPGLDGTVSASARFPFPRHVVVGYSFRPTAKWNFEVNADWTEWDRLNTVTVVTPGAGIPMPFEWESSWFYEFGVTRRLGEHWRVSGGYIYSENSVPDATFTPAIPDSDRHIFSVGLGRDGVRWRWDVAYQVAWGPDRTVEGNTLAFPLVVAPAPALSADGRYTSLSHALTASLGIRF